MPRRNNPITTLLIFLAVCGFGWASYEFIYVRKIFHAAEVPSPPPDQVEGLKRQIEEAMSGDACFVSISSINWRPNQNHYRVDVQMMDGCEKAQAQRLAGRVLDLVRRGSNGIESEVWLYSLGREVYHRLP